MPLTNRFGHWAVPVTKQAGAYTVQTRDFGSIIESTGALTATLPPPGPGIAGCWVQFYSGAAGNLVVETTANLMVAFNDATATSVAMSTDTQEIGGSILMLCDGTMWLAFIDLNQDDQAVTVA